MPNDPLMEKVNDPTLKTILKYQTHSSILVIETKLKNNSVFAFSQIALEEILKGISNLDISKSSQDINVLKKIIKENSDAFPPFICQNFKNMNDLSIFLATLSLYNFCFLKKDPKI